MSWLKCISCHAAGRGYPEYVYLGENPSEDLLADVQWEWHNENGDPEGYRKSDFEIVDFPPIEEFTKILDKARSDSLSAHNWYMKLANMSLKLQLPWRTP